MQGTVEKLVNRVGGLPLAINHVGSLIGDNVFTLEKALEIYEEHDEKVINELESSGANFAYEKSMSTAWSMSISSLSPATIELLEVFALLDPDSIPMTLVSHFKKPIPKGASPAMAKRAIQTQAMASLVKKALVKKKVETDRNVNVWIHRVVQDAIKCNWSPEARQFAFDRTCFCICRLFPQQIRGQSMIEQYQDCAKYQSHLLALEDFFTHHSEELVGNMEFSNTLANGGWYFFERGQTNIAYKLLETAEKIALHLTHGEPSVTLGLIYNNMGAVWATRGDRKTGAEMTGKAIEHREKRPSRDDPDIQELATSYSNYANHLRMLGRIDEAKEFYFKGLDIRRTCPGSTPELEELTLSNIAGFFSEQPDKESMDLALKYIKQSLDLHPNCSKLSSYMLITEYGYGKILASLGRYKEAYDVQKACLKKRQDMESDSHYITGTSFHRTGCLAYQLSKDTGISPAKRSEYEIEAVKMLRNARKPFLANSQEPGLPPRSSLKLSWVLKDLGQRDNDTAKLDEAEKMLVEARQGFEQIKTGNVKFPTDDLELDLIVRPTFR